MDGLKNRISQLKKTIADQKEESKKLKSEVKKIISEIFNDQKTSEKYIKDFYFKSGSLIIFTKNKTFANEIFFKKMAILEKFQKIKNNKVSDLIIK